MVARELARIELNDGSGHVVLYDPMTVTDVREASSNLVKLNQQNALVWRALPVQGPPADCFVQVELVAGEILADTYSGYRVAIDTATGRIERAIFNK